MSKIDPRLNRNLYQLYTEIWEAVEVSDDNQALALLEDYGRYIWNKALDWAAENVTGDVDFSINGKMNTAYVDIDKNSILRGKICKDLEI